MARRKVPIRSPTSLHVELSTKTFSEGGGAKLLMRDVEVLDIRQKYRNGMSITNIAREAGYCEKTVRKWIKNGSSPRYKPRPKRPSKLDPYKDYIMQRMAEGVFNCEILLREIKALGYTGGKTLVKNSSSSRAIQGAGCIAF